MNRALLLVICDFLLLSLLAIARFEEVESEPDPADLPPPPPSREQADLIAALQLALEAEQVERLEREEELAETIQRRDEALQRQDLRLRELSSQRDELEAERARLADERTQAERELERAGEDLEELETRLQTASAGREELLQELGAQRERERFLQDLIAARESSLAEIQASAEELQRARDELERERTVLATRLESAEVQRETLEVRLERERLEREQAEQRASDLAEGVSQLAANTTKIQEEIRASQPLTSNTIFEAFRERTLNLVFIVNEPGVFGPRERSVTVPTLLVQEGGGVVALFAAPGTPFEPGVLSRASSLEGRLAWSERQFAVTAVSPLAGDPRILAVRLPGDLARALQDRAVPISDDPLRFPEAVLVRRDGSNYGAWEFRLAPGLEGYVSVPSSFVNRLFGEFSPTPGDPVFAQSGALLGFMVDREHAHVLEDLERAGTLGLGQQFSSEQVKSFAKAMREAGARLESR